MIIRIFSVLLLFLSFFAESFTGTRMRKAKRDAPAVPMISRWKTDNMGGYYSPISGSKGIQLPLRNGGNYNFVVDWGDSSIPDTITSWNDPKSSHEYAVAGTYTVTMTGVFDSFNFGDAGFGAGDHVKIIDISQWGSNPWKNMSKTFYYCVNLEVTATDAPDLRKVTSTSYMLGGTKFNGPVNHWDTSNVIDMSYMFSGARLFNQPVSFNTSKVTNMAGMFNANTVLNQPVTIDTANVTNMSAMFGSAEYFNQPVSFNTGKVTNMSGMFSSAVRFNQAINFTDTSKVTTMEYMFTDAYAFNQPLNFNTSSVTILSYMFNGAHVFNQPVNFITSNVTNMRYMFASAWAFNQSLLSFDTSKVTNIMSMFSGASSFNQSLAHFDTSKVTEMGRVFRGNGGFDQDLSGWVVSPNVISCKDFSYQAKTTWLRPNFTHCDPTPY